MAVSAPALRIFQHGAGVRWNWVTLQALTALGLLMLILMAPLLTPHSTTATSLDILNPPSTQHWMGTDTLGRDTFSRFLAGGRLVTVLSICAGFIAAIVGAGIGMVAGYRSGIVDAVLMRMVDVLLAMPPILVLLVMATALPRSNVIVALLVGALLTPSAARVIRGITQQVASREYVLAAEAAGEPWYAILIVEILPNVRGRLLLEFALRTGFAVLAISSLNFLGLGASPPTPDWGLMVSEGRPVLAFAPWVSLFPAAGLVVLVLAVNMLADALGELWA